MSDAILRESMEKLQESALKLVETKNILEREYKEALEKIEDDSIKAVFAHLRGFMQLQ